MGTCHLYAFEIGSILFSYIRFVIIENILYIFSKDGLILLLASSFVHHHCIIKNHIHLYDLCIGLLSSELTHTVTMVASVTLD